jgi:DNA-binding response OmpR family regulator
VRVLIVEDEPATALLLEGMLTELGFEQVHIAYDPGAARDAVGAVSPDLAILDITMGHESMLRLAEKLRARNVPVLFSSGQPMDEMAPEWSGRPLVPKPLDKRMLHAALRNLGFDSN